MQLIDISPLISEKTAVFPGDKPFERTCSLSFSEGHHLALSSISSTLHIGVHADAPNHYHPDGCSISERSLHFYYGTCQVITIPNLAPEERILPKHLQGIKPDAPRILLKTNSFPCPEKWVHSFNSLSPELVDFLADQGVILIGIDTPSVDPAPAKVLISHLQIFRRDLAILEGLVLDGVEDGFYTLSAFPLKINGADASPVRAVLIKDEI